MRFCSRQIVSGSTHHTSRNITSSAAIKGHIWIYLHREKDLAVFRVAKMLVHLMCSTWEKYRRKSFGRCQEVTSMRGLRVGFSLNSEQARGSTKCSEPPCWSLWGSTSHVQLLWVSSKVFKIILLSQPWLYDVLFIITVAAYREWPHFALTHRDKSLHLFYMSFCK